jgi:hypothetical protein
MDGTPQLALAIAPTAQVSAPAGAGELARTCDACGRKLPASKRADARTCGKSCRQRKSRRNRNAKVSPSSRAGRRLLTEVARRRALEGVDIG